MAWNNQKLKFFSRIIYLVVTAWIVTVAVLFYALVDGAINPVVTPLEISSMRLDRTDDWTRVNGTFEKLRDCSLEEIRWYYGDRESFSRVESVSVPVLLGPTPSLENPREPKIRHEGKQRSDFLRVRLSPELIVSDSYAYVYHNCHGNWLWRTRSLFYDSELQQKHLGRRNPHP